MHALIGRVRLVSGREDEALKLIKDHGEALVRNMPGAVAGYWARTVEGDIQHAVWIFDSRENAQAAMNVWGNGPPAGAPATQVSVELCEIVGRTT
jgi:hypothetical protein